MLINGKCMADWHPVQATDEKGGFVRQTSSFRNWVTPDGSAGPTGQGGFKPSRAATTSMSPSSAPGPRAR